MKKHQNIGKLAEMGGSGAEVVPHTPYVLLPLTRNSSTCRGIWTSILMRQRHAS